MRLSASTSSAAQALATGLRCVLVVTSQLQKISISETNLPALPSLSEPTAVYEKPAMTSTDRPSDLSDGGTSAARGVHTGPPAVITSPQGDALERFIRETEPANMDDADLSSNDEASKLGVADPVAERALLKQLRAERRAVSLLQPPPQLL